jgi:hypothetical protein
MSQNKRFFRAVQSIEKNKISVKIIVIGFVPVAGQRPAVAGRRPV